MNAIAERLGEVGLPEPVNALAARDWDVVVVGGGHNGLTCAAYLARAGLSVLVLERRERLGGACTLERPFPDQRFVVSPCAYLVGLLDERVIRELGLRERGLQTFLADPNLWIPFEDGSSFGQWADARRTQAELEALGVSSADIAGYWRYQELFAELRRRLRAGARDAWEDEAPTREEIEALLGGESHLVDVVFAASVADLLDEHVADQRLKDALWSQGVIGTYAGPREPGTAAIHLMHYSGELDGHEASWGYVKGGMGMVSFALADAALEAGAVLAAGVPVAAVAPGEGVELEDGTAIRARTVVCNADPKVARRLLDGPGLPAAMGERLDAWDTDSPVLKLNAALHRLPRWTAAGDDDFPARGTVSMSEGLEAGQAAVEACRRGEPRVAFAEVYVQTGHDPSPAPPGRHSMSVFAQYAPYTLAEGTWATRREDVTNQLLGLVERFAPDVRDCLEAHELLGPPDLEARIGLTGGHIFQGDCRPAQMWDRRLSPRTELPGFYFCGAATHPGGSVIALNGRNAARAVLADRASAATPPVPRAAAR